ncbi:hypothetical protein [Trinickia sp. EG282A]|uniref:hypothetical protein n=1 Tax=Trinickia sp. EG282A TaxID=3237013 RepID=UPI0034D2F83C
MTFKTEIFDIGRQVAVQTADWAFSSAGDFVNKGLKHTDLVVSPGFTFNNEPSCSVTPIAGLRNKKIIRLCKEILGRDPFWTLSIKFQLESEKYRGPASPKRIYPRKVPFTTVHGEPNYWPADFITQEQTYDYLRGVLADGNEYLGRYFNFESEEALLSHLPMTYRWMDKGIGNAGLMGSFYEQMDGIIHCLAAIVLGNFEFVERYASDDFKTMAPKRMQDLAKIISALPELQRRFAETGKVV